MSVQWNTLTNKEKNKLIAKEVLQFDCFQKSEDIEWYERHYSLGHWRYSTDIKDALDLASRVINKHISLDWRMENQQRFRCQVVSKDNEYVLYEVYGHSLPDVICLAACFVKNVKFYS